jgi:putative oxidoreductase
VISISESAATWLYLLGRIGLGSVFLVSAIHKAFWYKRAVEEFKQDGIPLIPLALPGTIVLHAIAPVAIIAGVYVMEAALALAVFTVLATLKVHNFWAMQGEQRLIISRVAGANFAVVGGLLVLAAFASGKLS